MSSETKRWVVDDALLSSLFGEESPAPAAEQQSASKGLSRAIGLHLDGKLEEALAELSRSLTAENTGEILSARGHIEFELGRYGDAARSYTKVAEENPEHSATYFNLGLCRVRLKDYPEAIALFEKSIEREPARANAYLGLGICLLRSEQAEEAVRPFDRYLRENPHNPVALFGRAVALQLSRKLDEAEIAYKELLEIVPDSEPALLNLIALGLSRKDTSGVRQSSESLLKLRPHSTPALEGLATAAFSEGDFAAAARHCSELVKAQPGSSAGWFNLGVAYQRTRQLKQAETAYGRALEIAPEWNDAWQRLACLRLERGDLSGCLEAFDAGEPSADLCFNIAVHYEELGNMKDAARFYRSALERAPAFAEAFLNLGHALEAMGQREEARTCWSRALQLKPELADGYFDAQDA